MKRRNFLMAVAGAVAAIPLAKTTVAEAEVPHGSVTAIEPIGESQFTGLALPAQSIVSQWDTGEGVNTLVSLPSHTHPLPALSWEARMHDWLEDRATLDRARSHAANLTPYHGVTLERAWRIVNDPEYVNYHGEFPEYDANYPIEQIAEASGQFAYFIFDARNNESIRMSYWLQYADATIESQELASRSLYVRHRAAAVERALENIYKMVSASALVSRDFSFIEGTLAQMPDTDVKARLDFLTRKIE